MASGDTLLIFTPLNNEAPNSNYATLDVRNNHPVLDFDDALTEDSIFSSILPRAYSGGGLTVSIFFTMSSAVTGDVYWKVRFERIGEVLDIDADGYGIPGGVTKTVSPTSGMAVKAEIAYTDGMQIDYLEAGELFRLKIQRDGGSANDTAIGDAELLAVEIKET